MSRDAVVLLNLQVDFLGTFGRLPVPAREAKRVIGAANAVLSGDVLPAALRVLVSTVSLPATGSATTSASTPP